MELHSAVKEYLSQYIDVTDEEVDYFLTLIEIRKFEKKQFVIREGEKERYLNYLVSGLARKFFLKRGEEHAAQIAKEGMLISCYDSFVSGRPSMYSVDTLEPTEFISLTYESLEKLYKLGPKWERLGRLIATQQFLNWEVFEYERVRMTSQERFLKYVKENADLLQRVPQKILASYLNMKPETFSRLKHLIRHAG